MGVILDQYPFSPRSRSNDCSGSGKEEEKVWYLLDRYFRCLAFDGASFQELERCRSILDTKEHYDIWVECTTKRRWYFRELSMAATTYLIKQHCIGDCRWKDCCPPHKKHSIARSRD